MYSILHRELGMTGSSARRRCRQEESEAAREPLRDEVTETRPESDHSPSVSQSEAPGLQRSVAGRTSHSVSSETGQYTAYDPGPDGDRLAAKFGVETAGGARGSHLQRLADEFGDGQVKQWADEGMPVQCMGKPREMQAFRNRQTARPDAVPADVERQNRASLQRNTGPARRTEQSGGGGADRAGDAGVPGSVREVISSPGRSLDESIQREMGERMGDSFEDVRIHTGPKAARAAERINARAFTVGNHVAFNRGEYDPESNAGRRVLAHELTHVRQQTDGEISMLPKADGLQIDPDPALEREAQRTAERVVENSAADGDRTVDHGGTEIHLQRQVQGDEEESEQPAERNTEDLTDEQVIRLLFREQLADSGRLSHLQSALFEAESAGEAREKFDEVLDTEARREIRSGFAEHTGLPIDLVQFEFYVIQFEAGERVEVSLRPSAGTRMQLPAERESLAGEVTTTVEMIGEEEGPLYPGAEEMEPFLEMIEHDEFDVFVPDPENTEIATDGDGNPIITLQQPEGEMEMDPEEALDEAFEIFMESEAGQRLQAKADELEENVEEQLEEIWETAWGKAALSGIVATTIGLMYATDTELPQEAVQTIDQELEIMYRGESFEITLDPRYAGVPLDSDEYGATLEADFEISDDLDVETELDYDSTEEGREFGADLDVEGDSWELESETEYEEGSWSTGLEGDVETDSWRGEFETDLYDLGEGIEGYEAEIEGGYDSDTSELVGELGIQDTDELTSVLAGIEGELGSEMWRVGGQGRVRMSPTGHRYLTAVRAELGEEGGDWSISGEASAEGHSLQPEGELGAELGAEYEGDNFELEVSGEYLNEEIDHGEIEDEELLELVADQDRMETMEANLLLSYQVANRLRLRSKSMVERTPRGTNVHQQFNAGYQLFNDLETDIEMAYERGFGGDGGGLSFRKGITRDLDPGELNLSVRYEQGQKYLEDAFDEFEEGDDRLMIELGIEY